MPDYDDGGVEFLRSEALRRELQDALDEKYGARAWMDIYAEWLGEHGIDAGNGYPSRAAYDEKNIAAFIADPRLTMAPRSEITSGMHNPIY